MIQVNLPPDSASQWNISTTPQAVELHGSAAEYALRAELEVVRNILRDAPRPDNLKDYDEWYDAMCDYLETCP